MEAQGYEIKRGQADFIPRPPARSGSPAARRWGEDYTEEAIARRIKGLAVDRGSKRKQAKGITLRIDLENNIKAQQSAGICAVGEAAQLEAGRQSPELYH